MAFWIVIGIITIITIGVFVSEWGTSYGMPFMGAFVSAVVGSFVGAIILLLLCLIPVNVDLVRDDTYKLKALGNANTTTGRFYFLGGGYINGERVLNYISQRDSGAILVEQSKAKDSTIFEGSAEATVRVRRYDYINGWILPWPMGSADKYEFRIPEGSVVESYTLDNQ
jgi:hypothetical protein